MAVNAPFFNTLPLEKHGLEWIRPPVAAAHPFDGGGAVALLDTVDATARSLGVDGRAYNKLMDPMVADWPWLAPQVLGPMRIPKHPLALAQFGLRGLPSVTMLARRFQTPEARGLLAGMAAHSMQPLDSLATAAVALIFLMAGHSKGWPMPRGGSSALAQALGTYFRSLGGVIETGTYISSLDQLPSARALLLDISPRQLLQLGGHRWSGLYRRQLERYRYGMGVFKVDWALDGPIPFSADVCHQAGTVHLGGTLEEIVVSEAAAIAGHPAERPFLLLTQQSLFDVTRAPAGKHTGWAYCHVPNGSRQNMTDIIERQVERFAPGFRERILARHTMDTAQLEEYNPNYIGGDINGGNFDIGQMFTRPALRFSPYRTSAKGIYLCSASTPPGGGVHGMCGFHAARRALKDIFRMDV